MVTKGRVDLEEELSIESFREGEVMEEKGWSLERGFP